MSFQKLSSEGLRKIQPFLESQLPQSAMMMNIVNMTLSGKYPDEDHVDIHAYNGAFNTHDMFIVAILKPKNQDLYSIIYAPDIVNDEMLQAFSELYDWTKSFEFGAVIIPFSSYLEKVVNQKGGTISKNPAADMYLPPEASRYLNIKRGDLEDEFELDKLVTENAAKVNEFWKYGGDVANIADAINCLGCMGVFKKKLGAENQASRSNEDLVCWVVFLRLGTLNALHCLDEYRRKGLAKWTMEAASKWIAEEGFIPLCEIEPYNTASRSLVEKIGFKFIHDVYWMHYKPPIQQGNRDNI